MRAQMKEIADAANMYFLNEGNGYNYAPDSGGGVAPAFVPEYLASWPTPPYSGSCYDYDNWDPNRGGSSCNGCYGGNNGYKVEIDEAAPCNGTAHYTWCIYTEPGSACGPGDTTIVNTQ